MSTLDHIFKWADALPHWQSDAVRRILTKTTIAEADIKDLAGMVKHKNGLPVEGATPTPVCLQRADVSGASASTEKIVLKTMGSLKNVNAISTDQPIPFGNEGLTIIYGENGSGKSGYSRVLKKACSARVAEEIGVVRLRFQPDRRTTQLPAFQQSSAKNRSRPPMTPSA